MCIIPSSTNYQKNRLGPWKLGTNLMSFGITDCGKCDTSLSELAKILISFTDYSQVSVLCDHCASAVKKYNILPQRRRGRREKKTLLSYWRNRVLANLIHSCPFPDAKPERRSLPPWPVGNSVIVIVRAYD